MTSSKCSSSFRSPPPPLLPHTYYNCFWCQSVWIPGSSVNHHLWYLKEKLKEEEQVRLGLCFFLGSLENIIHFKHGNKWIKIRVLWVIHFKSCENTSQDQRLRAKSRSIFSYTLHKSELWAMIGIRKKHRYVNGYSNTLITHMKA